MKFHLLVIFFILLANAEAKSKEKSLTQTMLADYCSSARPVQNDSTAVDVTLGVTLQLIEKVDISAGILTGYYWLNFEWKDEYLTWQGWDILNGQTSDIRLRTEDIWLPDIEVYNMIYREPLLTRDTVVVSKNGGVVWIPAYKITSSCKMDMTWFPFDDQSCDLKFGSWVYNGLDLNLMMKDEYGMDMSSYVRNSEWDLMSTEGKLNTVLYECCPESYLDITYTIRLRRRTLSYWRNVFIPSFFITLVSILSLLIPATSPTPRILVIILAFNLLCFTIPKNIPEISLMSTVLGWCYFIMFIVLIHSILVISIVNTLFLKSNSCINGIFRSIVKCLCCKERDISNQFSEEQVRYEFSRISDVFSFACIVLVFCVGPLGSLCSAPHFFVR